MEVLLTLFFLWTLLNFIPYFFVNAVIALFDTRFSPSVSLLSLLALIQSHAKDTRSLHFRAAMNFLYSILNILLCLSLGQFFVNIFVLSERAPSIIFFSCLFHLESIDLLMPYSWATSTSYLELLLALQNSKTSILKLLE